MIKAELEYNPYTKETEISFNTKKPRINSLVEKHIYSRLQSWIKDIPLIFHDEMNGYDFDMFFSGTDLEFEELKQSFADAGVSVDDVRLMHINKLENRKDKINRIDELLHWFENNPNKRFNYNEFIKQNNELLKDAYRYVILHAELQNVSSLNEMDIEIECIMNISEIENTDLTNTPILFYINEQVLTLLQKEIKILLNRKDISQEQLFFYIEDSLNKLSIERIIKDLGISNPTIIHSIDDNSILRYFEIYPITEYICDVITKLEKTHKIIENDLIEENNKVSISNDNVHKKIECINKEIELIKNAINRFNNQDELYLYDKYNYLIDNFKKNLNKWHQRKTKVTSYYEAKDLADELTYYTNEWFNKIIKDINNIEADIINNIFSKHYSWYTSANQYINYHSQVSIIKTVSNYEIDNDLRNILIDLKTEMTSLPEKRLITQFFSNNVENTEVVSQISWFMNNWKSKVKEIVIPVINSAIYDSINGIKDYTDKLDKDYTDKLHTILEEKNKEIDILMCQLSDEEKQLKDDNDWLINFYDQLDKIRKE